MSDQHRVTGYFRDGTRDMIVNSRHEAGELAKAYLVEGAVEVRISPWPIINEAAK